MLLSTFSHNGIVTVFFYILCKNKWTNNYRWV